jgi:hypothetical protein
MADTETAGEQLKAHENSWNGFKAMMTWGTLVVALIGFGVVCLIAPK